MHPLHGSALSLPGSLPESVCGIGQAIRCEPEPVHDGHLRQRSNVTGVPPSERCAPVTVFAENCLCGNDHNSASIPIINRDGPNTCDGRHQ